MSSRARALALAATVAMLPGACTGTAVRSSANPRPETAVVIGAGSVGSDYYPLGVAVCRLVNLETARHGFRPGGDLAEPGLVVLRSDVQLDAVTGHATFVRGTEGTVWTLPPPTS